MKWRLWQGETSGWSFYVGDDLFFPVRNRTYEAGNYFYASFAKEWNMARELALADTTLRETLSQAPIALVDSSLSSRELAIA